jgi:hypothetical protein
MALAASHLHGVCLALSQAEFLPLSGLIAIVFQAIEKFIQPFATVWHSPCYKSIERKKRLEPQTRKH